MKKTKKENQETQIKEDFAVTNIALASVEKEILLVFNKMLTLEPNCRVIFADVLIKGTIQNANLHPLFTVGLMEQIKFGILTPMPAAQPKPMSYVG